MATICVGSCVFTLFGKNVWLLDGNELYMFFAHWDIVLLISRWQVYLQDINCNYGTNIQQLLFSSKHFLIFIYFQFVFHILGQVLVIIYSINLVIIFIFNSVYTSKHISIMFLSFVLWSL